MKEKGYYWLFFSLSLIGILTFWAWAFFLTERKPINVPIYGSINFSNNLFLLPIILITYFLIINVLKNKNFKIFIVYLLSVCLIIQVNSLKRSIPFFQTLNHDNDYYQDIVKIKNLKNFLENFHQKIFYYSVHTRTHPPGPVIFHYLINKIYPNQKIINSLVMIFLSTLTIFIVYRIALFFKHPFPNYNILLFLSSPGILLYSATCMDMIFALLISLSIYLLLQFLKRRAFINIFIAGFLIFISSFFHYAAIIIPSFCLIFLILTKFNNKSFNLTLIYIGLVAFLFYLILHFYSGYSIFSTFKASNFYNTMQNPDFFMTLKRYFYSVSSNFIEYIIFLGLPIFSLFLLSSYKTIKNKDGFRLKYYLAFTLPVIVFNFLGIFKSTGWTGETGRVWLFLTPLIIGGLKIKNQKLIFLTAFLSFIQTLIIQLTLDIYW